MLEKESIIDQIEITRHGNVLVRVVNLIFEDGIEIAKSYHRNITLSPGDDLTGQDERVTAVANAVWTPEVIEEYERNKEKWEVEMEVKNNDDRF